MEALLLLCTWILLIGIFTHVIWLVIHHALLIGAIILLGANLLLITRSLTTMHLYLILAFNIVRWIRRSDLLILISSVGLFFNWHIGTQGSRIVSILITLEVKV